MSGHVWRIDILKSTQQGQHYGADAGWGVIDRDAHWRNLANTTESSVCGGAALWQIILCHLLFRSSTSYAA